ncbi:hypothetical protein QBC39DRAFT_165372 [Podospora conica]|nr:hypothetical protein QBC39DRAFT_165372 [Schizothecium conicum]
MADRPPMTTPGDVLCLRLHECLPELTSAARSTRRPWGLTLPCLLHGFGCNPLFGECPLSSPTTPSPFPSPPRKDSRNTTPKGVNTPPCPSTVSQAEQDAHWRRLPDPPPRIDIPVSQPQPDQKTCEFHSFVRHTRGDTEPLCLSGRPEERWGEGGRCDTCAGPGIGHGGLGLGRRPFLSLPPQKQLETLSLSLGARWCCVHYLGRFLDFFAWG